MADKSDTFAVHYRMFGRYNAWGSECQIHSAGRREECLDREHIAPGSPEIGLSQYVEGAGLSI